MRFADDEAAGRSPLYETLCRGIAQLPQVLDLLSAAEPRQRRPNLLLAAVHDLLLQGVDHELAAFYPSVGGRKPTGAAAVEAFAGFCAAHADAVGALCASRLTQTNEVARGTALMSGVRATAGLLVQTRLGLVEVGAAAGLNLVADRFEVRDVAEGEPDVPTLGEGGRVVLTRRLRGDLRPPSEPTFEVVDRVGLDRNPLDARNADDARWLRACVWPEHTARRERLDAALAVTAADPPRMVCGDAVNDLERVIASVDAPAVCVFHSTTIVYLAEDERAEFEAVLARLAATRPLARVSLEGPIEPFASVDRPMDAGAPAGASTLLGVSVWVGGLASHEVLARADPHGTWLEWLANGRRR